MLDCGIHPGYSGESCLPFFDNTEMDEIDVMLVTHFHLDHCAAVPYVTGKTPFKVGRQMYISPLLNAPYTIQVYGMASCPKLLRIIHVQSMLPRIRPADKKSSADVFHGAT